MKMRELGSKGRSSPAFVIESQVGGRSGLRDAIELMAIDPL